MIYRTKDTGKTFAADDAMELIRQLHECSNTPANSHEEWMIETAMNIKVSRELEGLREIEIDASSPEAFIAGLLQVGLITEVEEGDL